MKKDVCGTRLVPHLDLKLFKLKHARCEIAKYDAFFYKKNDEKEKSDSIRRHFEIFRNNCASKFGTGLTSNGPSYVEYEVSKVPAEFCHF